MGSNPVKYVIFIIMGALTLKNFPFILRSWNVKNYDSIDPTDSFGQKTKIYVNKNKVVKIEPQFTNNINNSWLTDKGRQFFDGIFINFANKKSANLTDFKIKNQWSVLFSNLQKILYIFEICNFKNVNKFYYLIVFENLSFLSLISQAHPFIKVKRAENVKINNDLEAEFQINSATSSLLNINFKSVLETPRCIGLNPSRDFQRIQIRCVGSDSKKPEKVVVGGENTMTYGAPIEPKVKTIEVTQEDIKSLGSHASKVKESSPTQEDFSSTLGNLLEKFDNPELRGITGFSAALVASSEAPYRLCRFFEHLRLNQLETLKNSRTLSDGTYKPFLLDFNKALGQFGIDAKFLSNEAILSSLEQGKAPKAIIDSSPIVKTLGAHVNTTKALTFVGIAGAGVKLILTGEVFGILKKAPLPAPEVDSRLLAKTPASIIQTDTSVRFKTTGLSEYAIVETSSKVSSETKELSDVNFESLAIRYDSTESLHDNSSVSEIKSWAISEIDSQAVSSTPDGTRSGNLPSTPPREVVYSEINQADSKDSSLNSPTGKRKRSDDKES